MVQQANPWTFIPFIWVSIRLESHERQSLVLSACGLKKDPAVIRHDQCQIYIYWVVII